MCVCVVCVFWFFTLGEHRTGRSFFASPAIPCSRHLPCAERPARPTVECVPIDRDECGARSIRTPGCGRGFWISRSRHPSAFTSTWSCGDWHVGECHQIPQRDCSGFSPDSMRASHIIAAIQVRPPRKGQVVSWISMRGAGARLYGQIKTSLVLLLTALFVVLAVFRRRG